VLLFLHSDTALPPDADSLIAAVLASGRDWGRFDLRIDAARPLLRVTERLINLRSRLTRIATGDQALFVRRALFERLGGFAEIPLMEDVEFTTRLARTGAPACIATPVITSGRRWLAAGVLRTIALMWRLRLMYFFGADPQRLADLYGYARRPPAAHAAVGILAKAPIPGFAKTRLIPALGAPGAARAQRRFAIGAVHMAHEAALGPVALWCAPDSAHRLFRALRERFGARLETQPAGDLGARLRHVASGHFMQNPGLALLIIGTDCPLLAPGHLQQAALALMRHDAVLIPAEDGGYVLIGLRRPIPGLFEDIAWSTERGADQTRERLRAAGASWFELPPLWDVDQPRDWERLRGLLKLAGWCEPRP
jgi:rSAM/selenodomain-associated transferase 1